MSDHPEVSEILHALQSGDLPKELLEQVASVVVEEMAESFSELSLNSRPLDEVLQEFREDKLESVDSEEQYSTKFDYIQEYLLEEIDAQTTEELTTEEVERYSRWRKYESLQREEPLSSNTLRDDMYLFREFVQHLVKHKMSPSRFEKVIEIPVVDYDAGDGVDKKKLSPEIAQAAIAYLRKYKYADVEHVAMELMCESGPRKAGLQGRDKDDFDFEEQVLQYEHFEETQLKNNEKSEREITLYGDTPEIIQDYLDDQRPQVTDSDGRKPLLTKGNGRISLSTLQKIAYKWTRPCAVGLDCPHDRDPKECEAAQRNNSAYKCPSSRAQKNRGVSSDAIDQRCDVSPRVQELHYDLPDSTEERQRFEDEFRNADDDPDSGFNHS
jgi:hypothetical protein